MGVREGTTSVVPCLLGSFISGETKMKNYVLIFCLFATALTVACNKPPSPTPTAIPSQSAPGAKRYHLTGRVVSTDKRGNSVMIDGDAIPDFMEAMTMPYTVKDLSLLDKLTPGDKITADVVVQGDDSWIENVVVTGHTNAPPKPLAELHLPAAGDPVPDFKLVNQDNRPISLSQYRGRTLLVTFIYTQCPFPDFCPRLSHQFAEINRQLQSNPALYAKTHLLSISFDPAHDTPKALRAYAFSVAGIKSASLFQHWEFAVPKAADLPAIATFFGLAYVPEGAVINHSLSTAVVGPDGRIFKWYQDTDWNAADLVKDAAAAQNHAS
jgi:protein SCO1/2